MAISSRQQALQNLANKVPVANAQLARRRQAAQQIQMRQQVAGADPNSLNMNVAQQAGAQAQQLVQQAAGEARQNTIQQQGQIRQMGTEEKKIEGQQQLADKEDLIQQAQIKLANKLANIDENAKQQVFEQRLEFSADEANRKLLQQRQLADFSILTARSRQDYLDHAQQVEQWHKRKLQIMETTYKSVLQRLKNIDASQEQFLDQESKRRVESLLAAYRRQMEREKARANNNRQMWTAGGTIVGAVVGGVFGGPAGAAGGAAVGGAVGGAAAGAAE